MGGGHREPKVLCFNSSLKNPQRIFPNAINIKWRTPLEEADSKIFYFQKASYKKFVYNIFLEWSNIFQIKQLFNHEDFHSFFSQSYKETHIFSDEYYNSLKTSFISLKNPNKPIRLASLNKGSQGDRIYSTEGKSITLSAQSGGTAGNGNLLIANPTQIPLCAAMRGRYLENGIRKDGPVGTSNAGRTKQYMEVRHDHKTNCLTTVQKDNNIVYIDITDHNNKKVRYEVTDISWRKLTPIECERLQTVADNYTAYGLDEDFKEVKISNTQRYKMLGNGWTIKVIEHFFQYL